ncbi:pilus biosynthesis protein [Luteimonas padinae]|uniref:Type IV pilin protein n=1 Tax=Luteimonas padinae TaxID=1714359 RepID=A0ABV6SW41_9GAMM|nr:type IV pilin protein [Luteimonas padinae]GHD74828.1 pilus biosynthesis protein [Luteimonas padinae]
MSPAVSSRVAQGFTLIELMITVAVIAILAAIALPSYTSHVTKTRRSVAQACLIEGAQFMERYYTNKLTYVGAVLPDCSDSGNANFYTQSLVSGSVTAAAYTIETDPKGSQANNDKNCGKMTIDQTGKKTRALTLGSCW